MFDIGFAELIIIGVVALLVVGPEKLPDTIRTASLYLNRIRRGFNEIKREVQQELHNDAVMRDLRNTGEELKRETQNLGQGIKDSVEKMGSEENASHNVPPDNSQDTIESNSAQANSPDQEKQE